MRKDYGQTFWILFPFGFPLARVRVELSPQLGNNTGVVLKFPTHNYTYHHSVTGFHGLVSLPLVS
jgi:hypothetical protein